MGNWNAILEEIKSSKSADKVRRKYLDALSKARKRNVVTYYSGWLQKPGQDNAALSQITDEDKAQRIAEALTDADAHKVHDRHIHADECKKIGLKIRDLESDQELQDLVLSVHHANIVSLSNGPAIKIIENHLGSAFVKNKPQPPQGVSFQLPLAEGGPKVQ